MTNFKAFTFEGRKSAQKAIDQMEEKNRSYIWLDEGDYAEISVTKSGNYRVHSTWAQDSSNVSGGVGIGALLGGMLGVLFGPGGLIAGAAVGGSIGGLIGESENLDFNDPVLEDFAASLLPDTSALIIIGDSSTVKEFENELADYKYQEFETKLDKQLEKELKESLKKK